MLRVSNISISIYNDNREHIISKISKILNNKVIDYKIVKKAIDARRKNNIVY